MLVKLEILPQENTPPEIAGLMIRADKNRWFSFDKALLNPARGVRWTSHDPGN